MLQDILKTVCDYRPDNETLFKKASFALPVFLSTLQLLLFFFCFKRDTPRQLCEENMDEECIKELVYTYKDTERRLKEYAIVQETIVSVRKEYPTYGKIFTTKLFNRLLKGILIITARNCCGFYIFRATLEDTESINTRFAIYAISIITAIFISFFTINSTLH
jgi:uncharacterized membrane protein YbaN (DUF454 family)